MPWAECRHDDRRPSCALGKLTERIRAFAAPRQPTIAVQDFTLDVARGEFLVIVGPSGCGKTTVLNMLAGLERADERHRHHRRTSDRRRPVPSAA